ncbi:MAG TPA: Flp pilus assembly protein CpaB [Chloroflexia bacterium]|nr:Flp pilus assembly protein CpaB [Chloroflexia bacterium]
MKARGGRFLLILGAALAAMSFVVVYVVMSGRISLGGGGQAAQVPVTPVMTTVVVAKADLAAYTMLDESNVTLMDVEATTALSDAASDPSSVLGKLTLVPLSKEQQIQKATLTDTGFSNVLQRGEKAFTIAVPERSTFGNSITENDRVDILYTVAFNTFRKVPRANDGVGAGQVPSEGQDPFTYEKIVYTTTKTLLQDVRVLRVMALQTGPPPEAAQNGAEPAAATTSQKNTVSNADMYGDYAPYHTVLVLSVTDQQAEVLVFARATGILDFTLRASGTMKDAEGKPILAADGKEVKGDHEIEKTTGISIDKLIEQYGIVPPPADPIP